MTNSLGLEKHISSCIGRKPWHRCSYRVVSDNILIVEDDLSSGFEIFQSPGSSPFFFLVRLGTSYIILIEGL